MKEIRNETQWQHRKVNPILFPGSIVHQQKNVDLTLANRIWSVQYYPCNHKYYPFLPFFIKLLQARDLLCCLHITHKLIPAIWFPWQHFCFSAHQNLHDSLVTQSSGLSVGVNHWVTPPHTLPSAQSSFSPCSCRLWDLNLTWVISYSISTSIFTISIFFSPISTSTSQTRVLGSATFPSLLIFLKIYFRILAFLEIF